MKQYIGTKIIEAEPAYRCMDGQGRPDCPRHKFPEKYLEMQRIVEQRRARAAETRRRNFQIIKGGKP